MLNKKIISLVIAGVMLLPIAAFAKDNTHGNGNNSNGQVTKQENVQDNSQKTQTQAPKTEDKVNVGGQNSSAKTGDTSTTTNNKGAEKKEENEQNRDAKKQQIEDFKAQMKVKKDAMKQIKQDTVTLKQQIQPKMTELTSLLNDIKSGKKTLPADLLNSLLSKADTLKTDSDNLHSYSDINNDITDTQDKIDKSDFNNALSSLDKVIARLQARLDALKQLNSDLDATLAIARQAVAPAGTTTTTTNTTVTPTAVPTATPATETTVTPTATVTTTQTTTTAK